MNKAQQQVRQWMHAFDQECPEWPTMPEIHVQDLRLDLIQEELSELQQAFIEDKNLVAVADAIADLLYVVYGTAVACGIDIEPIFEEVHRHNCGKLWTEEQLTKERSMFHPESAFDKEYDVSEPKMIEQASNVWVKRYLVKNKQGKVVKPPAFELPKIAEQLELQFPTKEDQTYEGQV